VVGRTMFGCRAWFVDGKMFAVAWRGNPVLRLAEADRAKACATLGAKPWSPGRGSTKEYVEIPAAKLEKEEDLEAWLDRSMRYARSLPARGARARTEGKHAEQRRQT